VAEDVIVKIRVTLTAGTLDRAVAGPELKTTPGALVAHDGRVFRYFQNLFAAVGRPDVIQSTPELVLYLSIANALDRQLLFAGVALCIGKCAGPAIIAAWPFYLGDGVIAGFLANSVPVKAGLPAMENVLVIVMKNLPTLGTQAHLVALAELLLTFRAGARVPRGVYGRLTRPQIGQSRIFGVARGRHPRLDFLAEMGF